MGRLVVLGSLLLCVCSRAFCATIPVEESQPEFWNNKMSSRIEEALKLKPIEHRAKNLILFLGDGMGVPTVTATRILSGQMDGLLGEENQLEMDKFPYIALSKVLIRE
ncbi:hypothetical protein FKM82_025232 [Ascaphus truei]